MKREEGFGHGLGKYKFELNLLGCNGGDWRFIYLYGQKQWFF